jgi:hypothetical protein
MFKQTITSLLTLGMGCTVLAQTGTETVVPLHEAETIRHSNCYVDTYDPSAGPYGGDNVYGPPTFTTGNKMPVFSSPTGWGDDEGEVVHTDTSYPDVIYSNKKHDGTVELSESFFCNNFEMRVHTDILITEDMTIVVKGNFLMKSGSTLRLAEGVKLTIYVEGEAVVGEKSEMNPDTTRPDALVIYKLGNEPMLVDNQSMLCGSVYATQTRLIVSNTSDFYGGLMAKSFLVQNTGAGHFTAIAGAVETSAPLYD